MWHSTTGQPEDVEKLASLLPTDMRRTVENWAQVYSLLTVHPEALAAGWWAEAYLQHVIEHGTPFCVERGELMEHNNELVEQYIGQSYEAYFDDKT